MVYSKYSTVGAVCQSWKRILWRIFFISVLPSLDGPWHPRCFRPPWSGTAPRRHPRFWYIPSLRYLRFFCNRPAPYWITISCSATSGTTSFSTALIASWATTASTRWIWAAAARSPRRLWYASSKRNTESGNKKEREKPVSLSLFCISNYLVRMVLYPSAAAVNTGLIRMVKVKSSSMKRYLVKSAGPQELEPIPDWR